ncbi:unnamed protein product [Calypogeia fissa]
MPIFRKKKDSASETSSRKRRLWRRKNSGGKGAVAPQRKLPKMTEWRLKGAERLSVAAAHLQERLSHITTWLSYQLYTVTHPCSPLRRRAARRSKLQSNLGATERRIQKEAEARTKSAEKRRKSWQRKIAKDVEHAKLLQ